MRCLRCGSEINDGSEICPVCGSLIRKEKPQKAVRTKQTAPKLPNRNKKDIKKLAAVLLSLTVICSGAFIIHKVKEERNLYILQKQLDICNARAEDTYNVLMPLENKIYQNNYWYQEHGEYVTELYKSEEIIDEGNNKFFTYCKFLQQFPCEWHHLGFFNQPGSKNTYYAQYCCDNSETYDIEEVKVKGVTLDLSNDVIGRYPDPITIEDLIKGKGELYYGILID